MKVGIFSPYLDILGGGERYALTVTEFFLRQGSNVDIFWDKEFDFEKVKLRFYLNISEAKIVSIKKMQTSKYDLIFWVSDGSIPLSFAKKNILHFQHPFQSKRKTLVNKLKLTRMTKIVCNSHFTKKFIDETYGVNSVVLYPPVDVDRFGPGKKEKIILSAGRFFSPSNPKNQQILIEEFKKMSRKLPNWELVLLGAIAKEHKKDLKTLENLAKGKKITIISDVDLKVMQNYFSKAQIYWHAAGYGFDLEHAPEKAEHFGITTVEAMSAGAVPIVFAGGGQLEIITDNKDGRFWTTVKELKEKTLEVINNPKLSRDLSTNAIKRSKDFSKQKFFDSLTELLR